MLKNYIKIAYRNIITHTSFSVINLFGLSVGVIAALIVGLYAWDILSFDDYHDNKSEVFLAYKERITPKGTQQTYDTWVPMADRLKATYPEVVAAAPVSYENVSVQVDEAYYEEVLTVTTQDYFQLFTFRWLNEPTEDLRLSQIVISEMMANKYFASSEAKGESLELYLAEHDTTMRFEVAGVFADLPENVSVRPDVILMMDALSAYQAEQYGWNNSFLETWVMLDDGGKAQHLEAQFPSLISSVWDQEASSRTRFKLLPMEDYYDTLVGDKSTAWTMFYIGIGILAIACINFMNLATARAAYRSKEIGLRKVMGAHSQSIRWQFLIESVIFSAVAVSLGLMSIFFILPMVNDYFDLSLSLWSLANPVGVSGVLLLVVIMGVVSGSYPAFYLSAISIGDAMRKVGLGGSDRSIRNFLMVLQFSVAVLLISAALMIRQQLMFMSSSDMGFEQDQVVFVEASTQNFTNEEIGLERLNSFKNKLASYSFVESVSASRNIPTDWTNSFTFVRPQGWEGDPLRMRYTYLDASFFSTLGIEVKQGRNFLNDSEGDQRSSVMINEAAYRAFNFDTVANPSIRIGQFQANVVGVVDDFVFESMRNEVSPTLHFHRVQSHGVHRYLTIRLNGGQTPTALETIASDWDQLGATTPFNYRFADDAVDRMYQADTRYLGMVSFFTIISILIACLGLYGLTLFVIEKRKKEISIRKVIGAGLAEIIMLVIRDFALWIVIAVLIGGSASYFYINSWIENYHYQAPFQPVLFLVTALIVFALVGVTVGYNAMKAALANPVDYLRED